MTVGDRGKGRIREALIVGAVVGATALTVGAAVAATSPVLVSSPAPAGAPAELGGTEPAPRVDGYSILRPSSLVVDTPNGLRIFAGTGMRVTGLPEPKPSRVGPKIREAREVREPRDVREARSATSPTAPLSGAAPATTLDGATVVLAAAVPTEAFETRVEKKRDGATAKKSEREAKKSDKKSEREAKKSDEKREEKSDKKRDEKRDKKSEREAEKRDEKEARRRGEDRASRA